MQNSKENYLIDPFTALERYWLESQAKNLQRHFSFFT